MPSASGAAPATPAAFSAGVAFSTAPTLAPSGLPAPVTPRLKEPMFAQEAVQVLRADWVRRTSRAGAVSVKISVPAGGEAKSLVLTVHLPPTWQAEQPGLREQGPSLAHLLRGEAVARGPSPWNGPCGVRTASLTHSRSAVSAGTWVVLPGSVTVSCARPGVRLREAS